jgi:Transketolase, thiamine diphosphate binding domain
MREPYYGILGGRARPPVRQSRRRGRTIADRDPRNRSPSMSMVATSDPVQLAIATIRTLRIDAVQRANSWHPGTRRAMALAYTLWRRFPGIEKAWLAASAGG